jgi:hypothetical protein
VTIEAFPMSGYLLKPADRDAAFTMDWGRGYLGSGETVAADLGWSIQPRGAAGDLVVTEQHHDVARSWARFAGGVPGRVYLIAGRVLTSTGRTLERAIVLRIALGSREWGCGPA